ncbi:hypothetical protein KCU71_g2206, partial [Aureobasidium melanogenum]
MDEETDAQQDLWLRYRQDESHRQRRQEHDSDELEANGQVLRYVKAILGQAPSGGYPLYIALHGGGGGPAFINNQQWYHMQYYYKASIRDGVYVAPRGIGNTWDLHFRPESYVLLERLIENMISFENVDPNRVYLLGYSAGGDGVYQITPRLAQRFAAVNMSAGHSNDVDLTNIMHVPFCIQMGEHDTAYGRHEDAVVSGQRIATLAAVSAQNTYVHEVLLHAGRGHDFYDEDDSRQLQTVVESPEAWYESDDRRNCTKTQVNTNAVDWVSQYTRDPFPKHLVWALETQHSGLSSPGTWYWLDIGDETSKSLGIDKIVASYDPDHNRVVVEHAKDYLCILLNEQMLSFQRDVHVLIGGQELTFRLTASRTVQEESLAQRNDWRMMFSARITLTQQDGAWHGFSSG